MLTTQYNRRTINLKWHWFLDAHKMEGEFTIGTPNFNFPTITPNMTANVPRDINALAEAVDTELAKKYTKPSSGIPLTDLSSSAQSAINNSVKTTDVATQSEATGGTNNNKFMTPLRVNNVTGTLTSLQTTDKSSLVSAINETFTQVVNGKDLIATAINDRGGSASGSDTFQQLADKIDGLVPKYSSGTSTSGGSFNFMYASSGNSTKPAISVSGLSFRPSRIILISGTSDNSITEYNEPFDTLESSIRCYSVTRSTTTQQSAHFRLDGTSAYINSTGFRLPVDINAAVYRWYAYE